MEESSPHEQPRSGYKPLIISSFIDNKEAFEGWLALPSQPWHAYTASFRPGPVATDSGPYSTQYAGNDGRGTANGFVVHGYGPIGGQYCSLPDLMQRDVAYVQPAYNQYPPTGYVEAAPGIQHHRSDSSITVGNSSTATNDASQQDTSTPAQPFAAINQPGKESLTRTQIIESARSALEAVIPESTLSRFNDGHSTSRLAHAASAHIRELQHQLLSLGFRDTTTTFDNILPKEQEPLSLSRRPSRATAPRNREATRRKKLREEQDQAVGALDISIPMRLRAMRRKGIYCARIFGVAAEYILLLRQEIGRLDSQGLDLGVGGYQEALEGEQHPSSRGGEGREA
ncbi:MAG: hypothetical protein Q9160_002396 [Pyrenula sp. 1 TL-2023]